MAAVRIQYDYKLDCMCLKFGEFDEGKEMLDGLEGPVWTSSFLDASQGRSLKKCLVSLPDMASWMQ